MSHLFHHYLIKPTSFLTMKKSSHTRIITAVLGVVFGAAVLTGCGQKGALYLPEDAPSNTDYIFYKGNKAEAPSTAEVAQDVEVDVSANEQDY